MRFEQGMQQQQKQVQKLAMTQQLQQSIQILHYTTDELQTFIEAATLENPLLEMEKNNSDLDQDTLSSRVTIHTSHNETDHNYLNQLPDKTVSLFEFLLDQIHLNYRDTYLRRLVLYLVEFVDNNGYLQISLEEAANSTEASPVQLLDALTLIQQLEPAGVGARNLQECLMLQTERDDLAPNLAYIVLEESFEPLVERKWTKIAEKYQISLGEVQKIFDYIQTLSPAPGARYGEDQAQFVIPDLTVEIIDDLVRIFPTKASAPRLQFRQAYFDKMQRIDDPEVKNYIKEKKAEYDWLANSITQRGNTILRVGEQIILQQKAFFIDPERPLKPLTLKEIAEAIGVHESTVSRAVNGKYLQTVFGTFELRSFFNSGVITQHYTNDTQEEISNKAVKTQIQNLILNENKAKPYSDQKIMDLLQEKRLNISRRTVAKYRDSLGILSSSKRKRYEDQ